MSRSYRFGLALGAGLLLASAGALPAQETDNNPDNTAYGTTSAEFLLFGAGARGTALGDAFAAIAYLFGALCWITTVFRVATAWRTLKQR